MKAGSFGWVVSTAFFAAASASWTSHSRLKGWLLPESRAARAKPGKPSPAASASAADPDRTCLRVFLTILPARPVSPVRLCAGTSPSRPTGEESIGPMNFKRQPSDYYTHHAALQNHGFAMLFPLQKRRQFGACAANAGIYPLDRPIRFAQGARKVEERAWHRRLFS